MESTELVTIAEEYANKIVNDKRLTNIAEKQIVTSLIHNTMLIAISRL